MRLRVLDFNVWSGLTYLGFLKMGRYDTEELARLREASMIAQIQELDPDVVCLHELNPVYERAEKIGKLLGMDHYAHLHLSGIRLGPAGLPWNLEEGDAIFVRRGIDFSVIGRRQMSGGFVGRKASWNFSDATQVLGVRLRIGGMEVPVYTTHWHAGVPPGPDIEEAVQRMQAAEQIEEERLKYAFSLLAENRSIRLTEAAATLAFIDETSKGFAILSGDFNAMPDTPEIAVLLENGFIDTLEEFNPGRSGFTWNYSENPLHQQFYSEYDPDLYLRLNYVRLKVPHRLDYVFYRSGAGRAISSEIVMKKAIGGVVASDHFGVLADFEIGSQSRG